jgi:hypothetical protein
MPVRAAGTFGTDCPVVAISPHGHADFAEDA